METFKENNKMAETKTAKLEERIVGLESDMGEARGVISRLSKQQQDSLATIGTLNRDVADLKLLVKAIQDQLRNQAQAQTKANASVSGFA